MKNLIPIETKSTDVKCGNCRVFLKLNILYDPVTAKYFEQAFCPECKMTAKPKLIRIGRQHVKS